MTLKDHSYRFPGLSFRLKVDIDQSPMSSRYQVFASSFSVYTEVNAKSTKTNIKYKV